MNVLPPLMIPHCFENRAHLPILVTLLSEELFDSRTLEMKLKANLFLLFFCVHTSLAHLSYCLDYFYCQTQIKVAIIFKYHIPLCETGL